MMVSANEIHHMIRKASLAIGFDHDRATDIGAAAVWLATHGQDGCRAVEAMLAATDTAFPPQIIIDKDQLMLASPRPAVEGIAALDWLIAHSAQGSVVMTNVAHGLLLFGLLGMAAGQYHCAFQLSVEGTDRQAMVTRSGCTDWTILLDHPDQEVALICLPPLALDNHNKAEDQNGHEDLLVAKDVWDRLAALAYQTYVPSSEESRLSGAGAGLNDND